MHKTPMKSGRGRKALAGSVLILTALCGATNLKANLIPANADLESSSALSGVFAWPTTTTWRRSGGLTPYTATGSAQSGSNNAVLNQFSSDPYAYFSLTFVGQADPLGGPSPSVVDNLVPIVAGQQYQVSFWANRWVDVVAPTDPGNMGFVDPASASLPDARITLQLYTTPYNDLSGGGFFGGNLAFNPVAGGSSGAYTQGAWTQYTTTFTANVSGYVELFFKVKDAADTSYFGAGATGVKYGLDNVSVKESPPANANFESSTEVAASPLFTWPTTTTWARGESGLTPYTDGSNPQSGLKNVVLSQTDANTTSYFGLAFVGQPDPLGGPSPSVVDNLVPIVSGQQYQVSFWANRWVDEVVPTDPANMGFVDPTSASLPDARLTLQLYTTPYNDLSGGGFFGGNLEFDPVAGGSSGAYTQGEWTQYTTTFTANVSGYVALFFKVKDAADTGYYGLGAAGVKYGLDNVSVTAVPAASGFSAWAGSWTEPVLSDTAAGADPDHDGLVNAMEYALGLDPRFSSASPGVLSNGGKTLTFTKGFDAKINGDVAYEIETSITLGATPHPWAVDTLNVFDGIDDISITFPNGPVKNFARLKVTLSTP